MGLWRDPYAWTARLHLHCSLGATSSPVLPRPPKYPNIPPHLQPRVTPTPTPPRRRPLQAAVEDTRQAAKTDGSGGWGQRGPGGGRQLGLGLSAGAAGTGPRVGSASARTNKAARAGRAQGLAGGRGRAWPGSWDRGGPECAPATGRGQRAQCPRRGQGPRAGLDSATARCGNRSAGAGSGARRPGQRRRRLPLLLPRSLLPRVLLLAGSPPPPPPQPRRFSGFSSPSRPGRPAGTIRKFQFLKRLSCVRTPGFCSPYPTPICWMLSDGDGKKEDCVNFTLAGVQKDCPR
ncbi:WAS/WASL-interacting protein family member 3-like [Panthera tigris]|uniref:WAS/WASL-interacting protein family member 3-like n=1 Tax=Panthera tigris TaxID=9694 RepID=UPI001C6F6147|nr:WAS/WASL-interacting protein family member 3-like [Panthera tigris]